MKNGIDGHNSADKRAEELKERVLKQYGVSRVEDLPVSFAGISLQEGEEYGNQVFDRHYSNLWDTFNRQNRFQQIAGVIAPLLAVRSLSMSIAGTDFAQHQDFAGAAESYRRMLVKAMNDDMTYNAGKADFSYQAGPELWKQVPAFQYTMPPVGRMLGGQAFSIAILSLWLIGGAVLAVAATARMRVESTTAP
ncbi:MAG TPA: DUF3526 domain-containing protein [Blastocatellia bacterium]|nr:DUF3526 domain-containing protein [Blastocatellia bacterium]